MVVRTGRNTLRIMFRMILGDILLVEHIGILLLEMTHTSNGVAVEDVMSTYTTTVIDGNLDMAMWTRRKLLEIINRNILKTYSIMEQWRSSGIGGETFCNGISSPPQKYSSSWYPLDDIAIFDKHKTASSNPSQHLGESGHPALMPFEGFGKAKCDIIPRPSENLEEIGSRGVIPSARVRSKTSESARPNTSYLSRTVQVTGSPVVMVPRPSPGRRSPRRNMRGKNGSRTVPHPG